VIKISRNSKCPCGSGKKYKQCCLSKEASPVDDSPFDDLSPDELFRQTQAFMPPPPPPTAPDPLRIQNFFRATREELANLMRTISMADTENLLSQHPTSHNFYLRYESPDLVFRWQMNYGRESGQIMIDRDSGKVSGTDMTDVALYCLYYLFHHGDFFFPAKSRSGTISEWWNKSQPDASPFGADWNKAQIEQFEQFHKLLQGIFGSKKAHKEYVILSFNNFEKPKGFGPQKLSSYSAKDRAIQSWRYIDIMLSICFSDGEILKIHDMKHPTPT